MEKLESETYYLLSRDNSAIARIKFIGEDMQINFARNKKEFDSYNIMINSPNLYSMGSLIYVFEQNKIKIGNIGDVVTKSKIDYSIAEHEHVLFTLYDILDVYYIHWCQVQQTKYDFVASEYINCKFAIDLIYYKLFGSECLLSSNNRDIPKVKVFNILIKIDRCIRLYKESTKFAISSVVILVIYILLTL